jgi:hypothetical protein
MSGTRGLSRHCYRQSTKQRAEQKVSHDRSKTDEDLSVIEMTLDEERLMSDCGEDGFAQKADLNQ